MFIVKGSILSANPNKTIHGFSDSIPGRDSWVLASKARSRTAPHELGHCLGLSHKNTDYNALMCQTGYTINNPKNCNYSDGDSRLLRLNEWDIVRAYYTVQ